jgi:magnesium transporter
VPVVDNAVYVDGRRHAPGSMQGTFDLVREVGGVAWIGLYRPDQAELEQLAAEFGLHPLAVEDAVTAHQRPKLERYDDMLFAVLRPARYLDETEEVEFGEVHVFVGPNYVITVRHAEAPDLAAVRRRIEGSPQLLAMGPQAVLYAVLDQVVDDYQPVVDGLENDIDEIEDQVFSGEPNVSRRIYALMREVIELHRATRPLLGMLDALRATALQEADARADVENGAAPDAPDGVGHGSRDGSRDGARVAGKDGGKRPGGRKRSKRDGELAQLLRDVRDHATPVVEQTEGFRVLLHSILTVNSTLVAQRQNEETQRLSETSLAQNEEVKRISSWAAILFAPTLVGTVYGMNFRHMPELEWRFGYPMALVMMLAVSVVLYLVFRRRGWL